MMNNLIDLTFYDVSYSDIVRFMTVVPSPKFSSSTLLRLNIKVHNFDDCLWILDGRFNNLQSLYIDLIKICSSSIQIKDQVSLIIKGDPLDWSPLPIISTGPPLIDS
jgi:hypothetical protein